MNKKLEETCHRILAMKVGDFELEMKIYCSNRANPHECGTAFCLAGRLAHEDGYPAEYRYDSVFNYSLYSIDLVGKKITWYFLFNSDWPNDFSHAHKRAQYLLDNNGQVPDGWVADFKWGVK